MIGDMKRLLSNAKTGCYAIPACNVFNDVTLKAAFEISDEQQSPVIIACTPHIALEELSLLARYYERIFPRAAVALHLDHGKEYGQIVRAIRCGFTSVMLDKSTFSYEENVKAVEAVMRVAHAAGVTVEAELGHVGQGTEYAETRASGLTRKEDAKRFVNETGVDCLAVAVGTSHGVYKGTPHLDYDLLQSIAAVVDVPLVLHGGSDTGDEDLQKAIALGIQKINLSTDLATGFLTGLYEYQHQIDDVFDEKGNVVYLGNRTMLCSTGLAKGAEGWKNVLRHYIDIFGSAGKSAD